MNIVVLFILTVTILKAHCDPFIVDDCLVDEQEDSSNSDSQLPKCDYIHKDLSNCTCGLDFVDCSNKGFYSLPSNWTQLSIAVTRLFFGRNKISTLNKLDLNTNSSIKVLILRKNQINSIDMEFFRHMSESLETISFCGNMNLNGFNGKLEAKNIEFKKLKELEINHLKEEFKIEDNFFSKSRFPDLVKLDLNNAQLSFEKMPFDDLNKLEQLRLDSNNLNKLPCESFLGLTSLKSLNLSSNNIQIRSFSNKCIQDMKKLNFLSLNSNGLTDDDVLWMNFSENILILDLSNNNLNLFPYQALKTIKKLTYLRIQINESQFSKNQIVITEMWPTLTHLDLSNSNINSLPDKAFVGISTEISDLLLRNCSIRFIDRDAFYGLKNLITLDLSANKLRALLKPSEDSGFDYNLLKGNLNITRNSLDCNSIEVEWFFQLYDYPKFDRNLKCALINGTKVKAYDYLLAKRNEIDPYTKTSRLNILGIMLLILIILVIATLVVYFVRRKNIKLRQQQYRYRYFTERSQDDGFDTDMNVPVYRDCTVSLQIKESDDLPNNNAIDSSSTAALTEKHDSISRFT